MVPQTYVHEVSPRRWRPAPGLGFYFGVVEEGSVQAGDEFQRVAEHPGKLRVADVTRLYTTERTNETLLRKASSVLVLPEKWRAYFQYQLEKLRK